MPNYVQIWPNGKITQVAIGFKTAPFPDAIEVPEEIVLEPDRWRYESGQWRYYALVEIMCSNTAIVGQEVTISASIKNVDGIEAVLYIDGVEQARGFTPATWQVVFETPGVYMIEIDAGYHGRVSREVVVS